MCLGEVLGRITNPGGSKSQPKTPDPIGDESVVSRPQPTSEIDKKKEKPDPGNRDVRPEAPRTSSSTSMTDTGINY